MCCGVYRIKIIFLGSLDCGLCSGGYNCYCCKYFDVVYLFENVVIKNLKVCDGY